MNYERTISLLNEFNCNSSSIEEESINDKQANTNNSLFIDMFLNPAKKHNLETFQEWKQNQNRSDFPHSILQENYSNLFRLMKSSTLPCHEKSTSEQKYLLKKCSWKGEEVFCSKLFKTVPTDSGICCAFNLDLALGSSNYSALVKEMESKTDYSSNHNFKSTTGGSSKGLEIVIDQHSNQVPSGSG